MTANKIKYGLKNVYVAPITLVDNVPSYATPFAIPGAVSLNLPASGEKSEFYADDSAYWVQWANDGYDGDLEIALVPDQFKTDVLGETLDANGAYIENANATIKDFAMMFEFQGDQNAVRHVLYNCNCSRPDVASKTKEKKIDPQSETLKIKASPAVDTGDVKARMPSTGTGYSTFFSAVYLEDAVTNTVDPTTDTFSKAAPADIVLDVTASGATAVTNVKSNGAFVPGIYLTLAGVDVTIDSDYFAALDNGVYVITVEFTKGNAVTCTVTVGA